MEALLARRAQLKTDLALEEDKRKKFAFLELLISISDEIDREREALLADQDELLTDLGGQLAVKDELLADKDELLTDLGEQLAVKDELLADKDELLTDLGEQLREAKISGTAFDEQS